MRQSDVSKLLSKYSKFLTHWRLCIQAMNGIIEFEKPIEDEKKLFSLCYYFSFKLFILYLLTFIVQHVCCAFYSTIKHFICLSCFITVMRCLTWDHHQTESDNVRCRCRLRLAVVIVLFYYTIPWAGTKLHLTTVYVLENPLTAVTNKRKKRGRKLLWVKINPIEDCLLQSTPFLLCHVAIVKHDYSTQFLLWGKYFP